ncbi:MAG: phytanoyl-CoA dioxygenase family protein [Caldilineaceae bacterium]|nr:phytanoyl-CoA dioxygenase family protein [Caldilineaceae bacterium]
MNVMTSLRDQIQAKYDSYEHHTIAYHILVNNEGQENERSFDVWASRAEIEAFAKEGYLVREALIEGEPLERLRCALDEVEEAEFAAADGSRLSGRDWIPRHLFDKHADFHDLISFDPLLSVARAVLGPFVRIRQLAARISYPGQPVQFTRWHHHQPGMTEPVPPFFAMPHKLDCLIYLDELNDANGLLAVMPGTHLGEGEELPLEEQGDLAGQQELRAPAGSCVMLHGNLWHRAMPTSAEGKKRRVLILSYGPTWMRKSPFGDSPENGLMEKLIEEADPATRELLGIGGYQ